MRKGLSSVTLVPLLLLVASGTGLAQWNGEIVAWGYNAYGQCDVPEPNEEFVDLAAGSEHSLGLKADSTIVVWGEGVYGVPSPNSGFVAVASGGCHILGLKQDGSIVAWGNNDWGQCDVPEPNEGFTAISAASEIVPFERVALGGHSLALKEDGSIVAWGYNGFGQCYVPEPNEDFVAVACGLYHSLGLKEDGSIVAWGWNCVGQCDVPEPNEDFIAVAAAAEYSIGLKENGSVVVWGSGPGLPSPNEGIVGISAGARYNGMGYDMHGLGLKEDGSIVAWGYNGFGQCNVPEPNEGFVALSAGGLHSLGLREISTGIEDEGLTGNFIQIQSVAPNPFPATTNITIALPSPGPVRLDVFDLAGRHVSTLLNQTLPAGNHTAAFDGSELPPGVYLVRLTSGSECTTAKVVLVR